LKNYTEKLKKLEVVSKPQIRLKSKAQADEKAQHTRKYVSILKRFATRLLGLRWGFETTSSLMIASAIILYGQFRSCLLLPSG
jgi:hypothetical protein